jgi:hypothetical protein
VRSEQRRALGIAIGGVKTEIPAELVQTLFFHCTTERVVGEICAAYFENRQSRLFGPTFLTNLKV